MTQADQANQEQHETAIDPSVLKRIYENYNHSNRRMVEEMELSSEHGGLTGGFREGMWLSFFRSIIPLKYQLAQGVIIIDSKGRVSNEVDIAVYDETYTPYVFQYNTLKFIPIEAVVMVIECKSTGYSAKQLNEWSNKIKDLTPVSSGIARIVQGYAVGITNRSQSRTRPIRVLVSLKASRAEKHELQSIQDLGDSFDFSLEEQLESASSQQDPQVKRLTLYVPFEDRSLGWWGRQLNQGGDDRLAPDAPMRLEHIMDRAFELEKELRELQNDNSLSDEEKEQRIAALEKQIPEVRKIQLKEMKDRYPELSFNDKLELISTLSELRVQGNALLTLNLQLNQLLMLLNNPMLFPHFAYAKKFDQIASPSASKA